MLTVLSFNLLYINPIASSISVDEGDIITYTSILGDFNPSNSTNSTRDILFETSSITFFSYCDFELGSILYLFNSGL